MPPGISEDYTVGLWSSDPVKEMFWARTHLFQPQSAVKDYMSDPRSHRYLWFVTVPRNPETFERTP